MSKVLMILSWALFMGLVACDKSQDQSEDIFGGDNVGGEKVQPRVIYGNDDRLDLHQVSEQIWKDKASATVALIRGSKVKAAGSGYKITTSNYGPSMGLCKSEPFYEQVTSAFCSGSLIAPDIIMTAGHCVRSEASCLDTKFVFNFAYKTAGVHPKSVGVDDVYSCKSVIHTEVNSSNSTDFALIRLDRKVVGHNPVPVRQAGAVAVGDPLVVIGHPSGLATKVAGGASVRDSGPSKYFVANLDTYGGNSGSAVFSETTGLVEGILVRGAKDFIWSEGCSKSNVCKDNECRGEDVTRVSEILQYVDASELVTIGPVLVEPVITEEPTPVYAISEGDILIPDNNSVGLRDSLVPVLLTASTKIMVDIEHSWIGDLSVMVQSPSGQVRVLHDRAGGSRNNLLQTRLWADLKVVRQAPADGMWSIEVKDLARADVGRLVTWSVDSK